MLTEYGLAKGHAVDKKGRTAKMSNPTKIRQELEEHQTSYVMQDSATRAQQIEVLERQKKILRFLLLYIPRLC